MIEVGFSLSEQSGQIDEYGTEVTAVTYAGYINCSAVYIPPLPIVFDTDHPFIYALLYKNHPLFFGQFL